MTIRSKCVSYMREREQLERRSVKLSLLECDPNSVLLDCGCSNGEFTLEIARRIGTKNIYAIDILKEYTAVAKLKGINVYQHDLNNGMPFADETFDVVHASHIIERLSNTDLFVKEIYRVLKFGGYAVISTNNLASIHNILYLIFGKQPTSAAVSDEVVVGGWRSASPNILPGPAHRRLFTLSALTGLCKYYGFQLEKSKGMGFYPFPPFMSKILTIIMKHYSSDIGIKVRKRVPNNQL